MTLGPLPSARSFAHPTTLPMRALLLFAVLLTAGCGSSPPTGLAAEVPGTSWTLERVVLADGTVLRGDGDQVTFAPDGSVVIASCNQCSGRYSMREDLLTVDAPLACTRRACPVSTVELERYLGGVSTLSRDGAYLVAEPLTEAGGVTGVQVLMVPASVTG